MLATCFLLVAAPQAVPAQRPQAFIPLPNQAAVENFGDAFAIDGDRALVAMGEIGDPNSPRTVWTYERQGLDWFPTAELPAAGLGLRPLLALDGDRAVLSDLSGRFEEFEWAAGQWTLTHSLDGFAAKAVDLEAGTALGQADSGSSGQLDPYGIAERGPNGWTVVWTDTSGATNLFGITDFAIEGDVAVIGAGPWFSCDHFSWDGIAVVLERSEPMGSSVPATWFHATDLREPDCHVESRLGEWVAVHDGQVFATWDHGFSVAGASIQVHERTAPGVWALQQEIRSDDFDGELGDGLTVQDGVLVSTSGNPGGSTAPFVAHAFTNDDALGWQHARRFELREWPRDTHGWEFNHTIGLHTYRVQAPVQTGIGARVGLLVGETGALAGDEDYVLGVFDPIVSASVCDGVANSTGVPAQLEIPGSDVLADNRMQLHVTGLPIHTLALPVVSMAYGFIANPGGSAGNLCVGASAVRLVSLAGSASPKGTFQANLDLETLPQSPLQSGDRLFFQLWYRDVPTTNFSSAVAVQVF